MTAKAKARDALTDNGALEGNQQLIFRKSEGHTVACKRIGSVILMKPQKTLEKNGNIIWEQTRWFYQRFKIVSINIRVSC
jgi:hypothetical protein